MEVVPTVAAIRSKAEAIRQAELEKAIKRLGGLSEKELETVELLTGVIVNKMLHGPTSAAQAVRRPRRTATRYVEAVTHALRTRRIRRARPDTGWPDPSLLGRGEKASAD